MKSFKLAAALFGAALLFAAATPAKESNKTTLNLSDSVTIEGKTIAPGTYTVEWNGAGPTVQVTIRKGKQTVATFSAQLSEQHGQNPSNAYGSDTTADGSKALTAIYVGGSRSVLQVDQQQAHSGSSANSGN